MAMRRRTARSCAAPFTCHACHRSSAVEEGVNVTAAAGAREDGSVATATLTAKALVRAGPGMAEGSEKQDASVYAIPRMLTSQSESRVVVANDLVAFTRGGFQPFSVQDADASVAGRNQPVALESAQHHGDGGTMHTEHDRQEFLFQRKFVVVNTIVCLQQPATASLLDVVEGIACRALHDLQEVGLRVGTDHVPERSRRGCFLDEAGHGHC